MKRTLIVLACIAALGATAAAAGKPSPPHGKVTISLPDETAFAFKPGPGAGAAQRSCLSCHSSAYVSTQPVLSKAQWNAEVLKMKNTYGAPITDEQVAPVVDYLTANYGKP